LLLPEGAKAAVRPGPEPVTELMAIQSVAASVRFLVARFMNVSCWRFGEKGDVLYW
jgi:hypothetical protein